MPYLTNDDFSLLITAYGLHTPVTTRDDSLFQACLHAALTGRRLISAMNLKQSIANENLFLVQLFFVSSANSSALAKSCLPDVIPVSSSFTPIRMDGSKVPSPCLLLTADAPRGLIEE